MGVKSDIENDVSSILSQEWDIRDGTVVPENDDVKLAGGGVKLDAVMFYADLADSTELVMSQDRRVVAKVYKSFLAAASRLIKNNGGYIRSFDGDRVMGVFLGDSKCSSAAKCGLQLKWTFNEIVKPKILNKYNIESKTYKLDYAAGIDVSDILVVRGGVRNDNDLLWVGRSANVAAKLSATREEYYKTFITAEVYKALNDSSKYASGKDMWTSFTSYIVPGITAYYKTSYHWAIS
jgi:class 3 adenylate cyclase